MRVGGSIIKNMKRDRIDRRDRRPLGDRVKRIQLNFRRMEFTLVGDRGRPWRAAIASLIALVLLILLFVFGGTEVQLLSSPEIKQVQERGLLRVGVRYDVPPLNGEGGLEHEIARSIARRVFEGEDPDNCLELIEVTSITATTLLDDGEIDMVIAMMSPEMAARYNFSASYYSDECVMVVPSGTRSFMLQNVKLGFVQSNALRIGAEDALLTAYMEANPELHLEKEAFASYPDLLTALRQGRVDGALMPLTLFEKYRSLYGVVRTSMTVGSANYAAMCATDTTVFSDIATLVIEELTASGELEAMIVERGL